MTSTERAKATLASIIALHGKEGVLAYQRLSDEFGPATVHRYLLELLASELPPAHDPRRI